MREFFQGWRRKVGCVTLVMACVVAGLWVRSRHTEDLFRLPINGNETATDYLVSNEAGMGWMSLRVVVEMGSKGFRTGGLSVPHWCAILPPTLLSAYLILWKPRKRTGSDHA